MIFLSQRFYVKPISENDKVQNMSFLELPRLWMFDLCKFQPSEIAKIHEKSKFKASKCVKMAVFALLKMRKIWATEKIWLNIFNISDFICLKVVNLDFQPTLRQRNVSFGQKWRFEIWISFIFRLSEVAKSYFCTKIILKYCIKILLKNVMKFQVWPTLWTKSVDFSCF